MYIFGAPIELEGLGMKLLNSSKAHALRGLDKAERMIDQLILKFGGCEPNFQIEILVLIFSFLKQQWRGEC